MQPLKSRLLLLLLIAIGTSALLHTFALADPGDTFRVSLSSGGAQANNDALDPTLSGDGRFVAFASEATNLITSDTNGASDIFVRDRQTNTTSR
ncbi:MAG: hypothetical protein SNJ69_16000, partial [Chloroflexaceae bacterium]